jgi:hypothetical protein
VKQRVSAIAMPALLLLAGCAGGNAVSGVSPFAPVAASSAQPTTNATTIAQIVITIPAKASGTAIRRGRAYVSPATQSMSVQVDSSVAVSQSLTANAPGCAVSSPLGTLTCAVKVPAPPGPHTFTFATYDRLGGTGNLLSTNTITQTIVANVLNTLNVTLDGVPAALQVAPLPDSATTAGSTSTGIQFFASTLPTAILIVAVDADGNYILGPGAPTYRVSIGSATAGSGIAIDAPPASNPNEFSLHATNLGTAQLAITATTISSAAKALTTTIDLRSTSFVSTIAGTMAPAGGYANGTGAGALFNDPSAIAYNPTTKLLYVADASNCAIRQTTLSGVTTTIAGPPPPGSFNCGYQNGPNASALFDQPSSVVVNPATGDLYVADNSCAVREVSTRTRMTTSISGTGSPLTGCTFADGTGANGQAGIFLGLGFDTANGDIYIADTANCAIRQMAKNSSGTWTMTTIGGAIPPVGACGFADGTGNNALFNVPLGIAYDSANGDLYVADTGNCAIRQMAFKGGAWVTTTIAGPYPFLSCGYVDGSGATARFSGFSAIAYDAKSDALFVTEFEDGGANPPGNCAIRRITPTGDTFTVAGISPPSEPNCGLPAEGLGSSSRFAFPAGITADSTTGDLYITDEAEQTVQRIQL